METDIEKITRYLKNCNAKLRELQKDKVQIELNIASEIEEIKYLEIELRVLGICKHSYSKAMNQPHPRLCIHCKEPEKEA